MEQEEFLDPFVNRAVNVECSKSNIHNGLVKQISALEKHWRCRIFLFMVGISIFIQLWEHFNYLTADIDEEKNVDTRETIKHNLKEPKTADFHLSKIINKTDWHNYVLINKDLKRIGPGEQGRPAKLPEEDKALKNVLYYEYGFNSALSDHISLFRSLPDFRHDGCKTKRYLKSLPTVGVVLQFYNEHRRTLLRTIYSIMNRSPPELLKEIFLVDDGSTQENLKKNLDDFIAKYISRVKVIHLHTHSGPVTARLAGAKNVTADVIIFLDSRTEVTHNWLPPLLEPIALNYKTLVCPFVNIIAHDTFEYRKYDSGARGGFDWEFSYKRLPILPEDQRNLPEPFETPVMSGGLFAISSKFFWELGGYDPGLDICGGEEFELSFKIWQCGGRILDAPCSSIGHLYRIFEPSDPLLSKSRGGCIGKNYRRIAEVWMDEYAQHLYDRRPKYRNVDPGDISEQKALRKNLKCKPFRWFITQIAFDFEVKFPPVEPKPYAYGRIRPESHSFICVDAYNGNEKDQLILMPCGDIWHSEQNFVFRWLKDIKTENRSMCWDVPKTAPHTPVSLFKCHGDEGNQRWRYLYDKKQIVHVESDFCFAWDHSLSLYVDICDDNSQLQKWTIEKINKEMLDKWDQHRSKVTGPIKSF